MATIQDNEITVGSARDLLKASMKLHIEVLERDKKIAMLNAFGVVNYHKDLTQASGSTLTLYNAPRITGKGNVGDHDRYSNATPLESGARTLQIRLHDKTVKYALAGSERQQISEFDLKARTPRQLAEWMKAYLLAQWMNQLGGNTGTSVYAPDVSDDVFSTTADRLLIAGHNTPVAPSTRYKGYGSLAAGSISADESVDADNPLRLADFMAAREVINSTEVGVPVWNRLQRAVEGVNVDAIALVSVTGMNQLKQDATTIGQGLSFPQLMYATLAGGQKLPMPANTYVYEGIAFVEMPDNLMPRGVHSGTAAPVANTRRAIIVGADALDFALGKGFSFNGKTVPGFEITTDEDRDKLNKIGYANVGVNSGSKKVQLFGTGANASTAYDNATFVITHYSRT